MNYEITIDYPHEKVYDSVFDEMVSTIYLNKSSHAIKTQQLEEYTIDISLAIIKNTELISEKISKIEDEILRRVLLHTPCCKLNALNFDELIELNRKLKSILRAVIRLTKIPHWDKLSIIGTTITQLPSISYIDVLLIRIRSIIKEHILSSCDHCNKYFKEAYDNYIDSTIYNRDTYFSDLKSYQ